MKKRVVAIVFSIIILCLCLSSCNQSDVPNGMKEAQDETNAFYTMYVPENWVVIETASNVTFAQARDKILGTSDLRPVTVNAMFFGIDSSLVGNDKRDEAHKVFYEKYQEDMKESFKEFYNLTNLEENHTSPYREDARAYLFVACADNIYYKYNMTVIIHNQMYYVITFNFPQNNVTIDETGEIVKTEKWEDAKFDDDKYKAEIEDVVSNFKPKK